jgi:hypothetical protein
VGPRQIGEAGGVHRAFRGTSDKSSSVAAQRLAVRGKERGPQRLGCNLGAPFANTLGVGNCVVLTARSLARVALAQDQPIEIGAQWLGHAALAIARNSVALRLALPTSAPSTLPTVRSSLALAGFTEPP